MSASPISLLIVDDDPVFARYVQQLVRALGRELPCAPTWVDTAEKALDEIRSGRYDLALLDYNLPGADGLRCSPPSRSFRLRGSRRSSCSPPAAARPSPSKP